MQTKHYSVNRPRAIEANSYYRTDTRSSARAQTPATARRRALLLCSLLIGAFVFYGTTARAQSIQFEDATDTALDGFISESWGVSFGDYNGDYWPDVFVGNHRERPSLYRNNGDGTFTDVILQVDLDGVFLDNRYHDHHGAAFGDYNNDGFDDLAASTNGASDAVIAVSNGMYLDDRAAQLGLEDDGAGWSAAWFDYNRDGNSDLARLNFYTSDIRRQNSNGSFSSGPSIEACEQNHYAHFADLDGDGFVEMICGREGGFPDAIYDLSNNTPTLRETPTGLYAWSVLDTVVGDFDGDLENEIVVVRGASFPNQVKSISPVRAEAFLDSATAQGNAGFTFTSTSAVTFKLYGRNANDAPTTVQVGDSATIFAGGISNGANFNISSTGSGQWTAELTSADWASAYIVMESAGAMSDFQTTGLRQQDFPMVPNYLDRNGQNWSNQSGSAGFIHQEWCYSITAGDYDNDGDLDIVMACRGGVENVANRVYENDGSGVFTRIEGGAGAAGAIGVGLESRAGTSESIITADYDNDGFLDLFLTNGSNDMPVRQGGPHQVFHNQGNQNNWILLKLRGVQSNADGLGARVTATASGATQMREQGGGYHRWSQNDQRIHFGLGSSNSVDIQIDWPSGVTEIINNVDANKLYLATEDAGLTAITAGPVQEFPLPTADDFCGVPNYIAPLDRGLFIFRNSCASNTWRVEAVGGQTGGGFTGRLVSTGGGSFADVQGMGLEGEDDLTVTNDAISFDLNVVNSGVDGFTFRMPSGGACLALDQPARTRVMAGADHVPMPASGFNIDTLTACADATLPVLSVLPQSFDEDTGVASVEISLDTTTTVPVTFSARTVTSGTATPGQDYYGLASTNLTIEPGQLSTNLDITILPDTVTEPVETIDLAFLNVVGANLGAVNPVSINDVVNTPTPVISVVAQEFAESVGSARVQVTLDRAPGAGNSVTASVFTVAGGFSATPGQDYYGLAPTPVNFGANDTVAEVDVAILPDTQIESSETIGIRIINIDGADVGVVESITIIDDDDGSTPEISIAAQSVSEAAGFIDVAIELNQPAGAGQQVSADFFVTQAGSTATAGSDYYGIALATVTFTGAEVSKVVRVPILQDTLVEGDETIVTRLINIAGANTGTIAPVTIVDDD